jgi:hypothetical protein
MGSVSERKEEATMSERRRDPAHNGEDETRDEEGKGRQERDASKEAVEEEEQTGGPPTQGDD